MTRKTRLQQIPVLTWKQAEELLPMEWTSIEVEPELYEALAAIAKKEGRSVFAVALEILEEESERRSTLSLPGMSEPFRPGGERLQ